MTAAAAVKTCVLEVVLNRGRDPKRALGRSAARALRDVRGGRHPAPHEVDDLVQDFLLKVLDLRKKRGQAALLADWGAMEAPRFGAYVRSMLKNLALDATPAWDVQRTLREMVKTVLVGPLPAPAGLPASLEKGGRFVRKLVAAAAAELLAGGVQRDVGALVARLSSEYALGHQECDADATAEGVQATGLVELEREVAAREVVATFMVEAGPEGGRVLGLRAAGFKAMAARLGLALSTAHARYERAERAFREAVLRANADEAARERAFETLVCAGR
jgi:DNA-directed RNA polymerase specialized sigma24 family protein